MLSAMVDLTKEHHGTIIRLMPVLAAILCGTAAWADTPAPLFPKHLPFNQWVEFEAEGFKGNVDGVIYSGSQPAMDGMPLGGVGTGCLDVETNGLLGYSSIFNSLVPRQGPYNVPFLGVAIDGRTWVLSTCGMPGVEPASEIAYWGHYPIADLQYDLDAPARVALRAWSPFIPGDVRNSNIPGAIFEVRTSNLTKQEKRVTLAFSFPGFQRYEVGCAGIGRQLTKSAADDASGVPSFSGIKATAGEPAYAVAALDEINVRTGAELGWDASHWADIAKRLPPYAEPADHDNSATSVAVDFTLGPQESRVVRFVLVWYFPNWQGNGDAYAGGNTFRHMYARRFDSVESVVTRLAKDHGVLLGRILAWQQVIYEDERLSGWLRDTLINSLHLITETAQWAQAQPPIGDWCRPEDGLFGMNECPRSCPQIECIPCTFYGNLPIVYFFPELALSTLRAYKAYQFDNGRPAWVFGSKSEMASPTQGYQFVLNGSCYAEIFNKLWLVKGKDKALLEEFYESLKKATIFTMTLRPDYGLKQIISMPEGNAGQEWFESTQFYGMCAHVGGVHLAHLRMAIEWAERIGDDVFALQCKEWLEGGSQALEEHLWADTHYLLYNEPETGHRSNVVMGYQLDGEWISRFHGFDGVFADDRVLTTLDTLERINANPKLSPHGALVFASPDGGLATGYPAGYWTDRGIHLPSVLMLGMTYLYAGQDEFGIELCRRTMENMVCRQRAGWDWGILYDAISGIREYGNDYYQDLVIWSLPAAIDKTDLAGPCKNDGLVQRILEAARAAKLE